MISYSEYRKYRLSQSIRKVDIAEGINKHFDMLLIDLLESISLPYSLNEAFIGEASMILNSIIEEDKEINHKVIREHLNLCRTEFHQYMMENVDFDAFIAQGGPSGLEGVDEVEKLKKKIKWALNGFKDHVKSAINSIISNRSPGASGQVGATPGSGTAPATAAPSPASPPSSQPAASGNVTPQANNAPTVTPQYSSSQPNASGNSSGNSPWWFKKTKSGPGWWKGSTNLAKSAVKGTWDMLKGGWRGDNLSDATVAELVNLVENLFERTEMNFLNDIDQWADKLYSYLSSNLDSYVQSVTSGTAAPTGGPSPAPIGPSSPSSPPSNPLAPTSSASGTAPNSSGTFPVDTSSPGRCPACGADKGKKSQCPVCNFDSIKQAFGKPKRKGNPNLGNMSDADFENAVRSGKSIIPPVLARKAAEAGFHFGDDSVGKNLLRYNAFRKKMGLPEVGEYPKSVTKSLTPEEIESYRGDSLDRLRSWAEEKSGKKRLRQLGTAFGVEQPRSRKVDDWKDFASSIHQKLQSGEQPIKIAEPEVAAPAAPQPMPTPSVAPAAQATEPEKIPVPTNDPSVVVPRPMGTPPAPSKPVEPVINKPVEPTVAKPSEPILNKPVEPAATEPVAPKPTQPAATPNGNPKADPYSRATSMKSNLMHDLKAFESGTDIDGAKISLANASQYAPSEEEMSAIIDQLAAEKGGLENVSDDDLLGAAHNKFTDNYIKGTGKSPDFVKNVIARIMQDMPQASTNDDGQDSMSGQPEAGAEPAMNPQVEKVLAHLPNEFLGQIDDETLGEIKKFTSKLIDKHPDMDSEGLSNKLMNMLAKMSQANEIYNTLSPNLKSQLKPAEMKTMIAEMLNTKQMQSVTCPNCEGKPGRKESCKLCKGSGKKMQLASIPESMVKYKILESIEKKKWSPPSIL